MLQKCIYQKSLYQIMEYLKNNYSIDISKYGKVKRSKEKLSKGTACICLDIMFSKLFHASLSICLSLCKIFADTYTRVLKIASYCKLISYA